MMFWIFLAVVFPFLILLFFFTRIGLIAELLAKDDEKFLRQPRKWFWVWVLSNATISIYRKGTTYSVQFNALLPFTFDLGEETVDQERAKRLASEKLDVIRRWLRDTPENGVMEEWHV